MKNFFSKKGAFFCLCLLFMAISIPGFAQNSLNVKGVVTDAATGETLIGVSVSQPGSGNGTVTDLDGRFTLNVPQGAKLLFSYIGYEPVELAAASDMNVQLGVSQKILDELVVVGYGVQKKSVVSAAISRVSAEDLDLVTPTRVEDVLKGKVSGVTILQQSGQPGAASDVRIRGVGTTGEGKAPLYIVDGMTVDGNISFLNPTDIASVEVLKDAASAAIYGTRGANGVILVTTKSGQSGKATVNYDFSYGWQNPWKKRAMLDAKEYMVIQNEMAINDNSTPRYSQGQIAAIGAGTDWQEEVFNSNAPVQSHQLNVNGGSDRYTYFLSFGYFNQEGIVGGDYGKSNYERYNLRLNNTFTVYEATDRDFLNKVKVGASLNYTRVKSIDLTANSEYGSVLGSAIVFDPTIPVYSTDPEKDLATYPTAVKDKSGRVLSLPPGGFQEIVNPIGLLNRPDVLNKSEDVFVGSFWAEVDILEGLKFRSSYGADMSFWGDNGYVFPYYLGSMTYADDETRFSNATASLNRRYAWQTENYFTYNKSFDLHNLTVMAGQSAFKSSRKELKGGRAMPATTDPGKAWIDNALGETKPGQLWINGSIGDASFHSLASYFARVNYNFDERYILSASLRRDGSSRFGSNNKWANFPAVSVAWNVLNEPYLTKPDWFDALKVRFSWGKNGNENIGELRYASFDNTGTTQDYYFGGGYNVNGDANDGTLYTGRTPGALSNPNLRWERSEQTDIGLDFRFLSNALTFSADYYKKQTRDMLMDVPLSNYVGQGAPIANIGIMENWGVEFELGWKQKVSDFTYYVNANVSYLQNKLVEYGNATGIQPNMEVGKSEGEYMRGSNNETYPYFYGRVTDGIFQNWDEINNYTWTGIEDPEVGEITRLLQPDALPGDVRFVDLDGNGLINDDDKQKIGKPMPDWVFGFTVGAEWKGFDVNAFFQGTQGNDIFQFDRSGLSVFNRPEWVLQRWHGEGTSDRIPRVASVDKNLNWVASDLYVKDGSYIRLKSAQFGYTLPQDITRKAAIQRLRVFIAGENLLTFTGYDGFDVEIGDRGIDRGIYPQSRTISIGANITF
ncbi:MAG: TonB-dependent receptor [Candidatus Symbiothrix sp.]|jgi:TonB-linked SusC/RagA family outer membrane protein|nr:TonB-dependent receptor [Candidatus Symbiothrix sp.]